MENETKLNIYNNAVVYDFDNKNIKIIKEEDCVMIEFSRDLTEEESKVDEKIFNDKHYPNQTMKDGRLITLIKIKERTAMILGELLGIYGKHIFNSRIKNTN